MIMIVFSLIICHLLFKKWSKLERKKIHHERLGEVLPSGVSYDTAEWSALVLCSESGEFAPWILSH